MAVLGLVAVACSKPKFPLLMELMAAEKATAEARAALKQSPVLSPQLNGTTSFTGISGVKL